MAMDIVYLIVFMAIFMGPMLIVGAIFEYVYYDIMGHDPDEPYNKD